MNRYLFKSFWLALLLCVCQGIRAFTVEDFFSVAPGVSITVNNDPTYPWAVDDAGVMYSTMHVDNGSATIGFVNNGTEAVEVTFERSVSSESGCDRLGWSTNGSSYTEASGSYGFSTRTLTLPAGSTLSFRYRKNSSGSSGSDCGYIRNLQFGKASTYTDANGSQWGYIAYGNGATATITSYSGNDFALTVPAAIEYNGYSFPVEAIGNNIFKDNKNLTSVTLPASLKTLGSAAFQGCTNLISVNIPDALTSIGSSAFEGCSSLATVLISGNSQLNTISSRAFYGCSLLSSFAMPAGVTSLESYAFYNCSKLTSIAIPDGLRSIPESAFYGCSALKSVSISDDAALTTIGNLAFCDCRALTDINFPARLEAIGDYAFATVNYYSIMINGAYYNNAVPNGTMSLPNIDLSKCSALKAIGARAFFGTQATKIDLSGCSALITLGAGAFTGNYYVTDVDLSGCTQLTAIPELAFFRLGYSVSGECTVNLSGCSALTSIDQIAFYQAKMTAIDLSGCSALQSIGSYAFASCGQLREIAIPDGVTAFGTYAFSDASRLKTVRFGSASALRSVGNYAFLNCSNLQTIALPRGVGSINSYTFSGCSALKTVTLAADGDLKSIGMNAFTGCSAMDVLAVPATVTSIASAAFNFGAAKTVLVFAQAYPAGYDPKMFSNLGEGHNVRIKIPAAGYEAYHAKYPDVDFITTDVERIELNYTELAAAVNNDYTFAATAYPEGAISAIQWTSSDEAVATITPEGVMHALAEGTTTITATALDGSGISASVPVTVSFVNMESIEFAEASYWLKRGNYGMVSITTSPADASDRDVVYEVSDPAIASVDAQGRVTALATGKTTITATSASNPEATATAVIDVREYKPARWIIEDKNGDGWFTLQDPETGLYLYRADDRPFGSWDYRSTQMSSIGEGDYHAEWQFTNPDNQVSVLSLEEGVTYRVRSHSLSRDGYPGNSLTITNDRLLAYFNSDSRGYCELTKQSDGTYILSVLGNSVQQETTENGNYLSFFSSTGANDDWEYTMCNTPYYPETLAAKMTKYKGTATDVEMPETVKFEAAQYPVFGISSSLGNRGNITSLTFPSTFRWLGTEAMHTASNLRKVVLPEGLTNIPYYAFYSCPQLDNVVLPSTVKSVDKYAFASCYGLSNITLSKDLSVLVTSAFDNCSALAAYTIPADNTKYTTADGVLYKKDMTDIVLFPKGKTGAYTIPSTMTAIRDGLFSGAKVESVVIPESIETIGTSAFSGCGLLTEVTIPASVKTIAENAFNANLLSKVVLLGDEPATLSATNSFYSDAFFFVPDNKLADYKAARIWNDMEDRIFARSNEITEVTNHAENGKINLAEAVGVGNEQNVINLKVHGTVNGWDIMVMNTKMKNLRYLDLSDATIVADEGYKYYGDYTAQNDVLGPYSFYKLTNLRTIALPKNITSIGQYALSECSKLSVVSNMPATCKTIDSYAFYNDGSLKQITIGEGVETIGYSAFRSCSSLPAIIMPASVKSIGSETFRYCSGLTEVSLNEGLETMDSYVFENCSALKTIELPSTLLSVPNYAFQNCSRLETVKFPKDLKTIGSYAFRYCSSLTDLKLPPYLERINDQAFNGCSSLKEIHIPAMLQAIGNYAFTNCGAKDVYAYTLTPITINTNTFDYTGVLHAPNNPYSVFLSYYSDNGWRKFLNVVPFDAKYETWYLGENQDIVIGDGETIPNEDGEQAEGEMSPGSGLTYLPGSFQWLDKLKLKWKGGKFPAFIDNGSVFVDELTFLLDVQAGKWYFFCFPFDIELDKAKFNGKFVWRYYDGDERASNGVGGWKNIGGNKLNAFQGYIFQTNKSGEIELTITDPMFTGGDKDINFEGHASSNVQDAGWNFVGNPNLSYYDLSCFIDNFKCPITVWDPVNNTYNAITPGDDDYTFHPFEAFFIQKPADTESMTFESENRETSTQAEQTQQSRRRARAAMPIDESRRIVNLTLSDGTHTDKTRVVFNDEKALGYEPECDAAKFFSTESVPQLYTLDATTAEKPVKFAINERPQADLRVALGVSIPADGTYTIASPRMDQPMALLDRETGTLHDFNADGDYTFMAKAGSHEDRFVLLPASSPTGVNALQTAGIKLEVCDGGLSIAGLAAGTTATVYNAAGVMVASMTESGHCSLTPGTYVVTVGELTSKVVVK